MNYSSSIANRAFKAIPSRYMRVVLALLVALPSLIGCIPMPRVYSDSSSNRDGDLSDPGISPLYPAMNNGFKNRFQTIDSLKPELKWTDKKKSNQTYEVCIWENPFQSPQDDSRGAIDWGTQVYSADNITNNFHQVANSLKPNTYYNWSVRINEDGLNGNWSAYGQTVIVLGAGNIGYSHYPFCFKTPP